MSEPPLINPAGVDIYPVGLLMDLQYFVHSPDRRSARRTLRASILTLVRHVREGDWREFKNHFNGYIAEPRDWMPGLARCGSGWTRGRAYRDLQRRAWRALGGDPPGATPR